MDHRALKQKIKLLASYQNELRQKDYLTIDIPLLGKVNRLRSELLISFGLPETSEYLKLLDLENDLTPDEVDFTIQSLRNAATNYLLTTPIPDIQLLREARRKRLDACEILPLLHYRLHLYNVFVYENILLRDKDSPENVYAALKQANEPKILEDMGLLATCGKAGKEEKKILKQLKRKGISYLDEYLEAYIAKDKKEK